MMYLTHYPGNDALQRYREKHKNYSLSFTGHSYGATIAILTALNTSMLNNQPSSPIRVTALLPAKLAGTSFMTYLKKYDIKVVTMIENMDEVSRMPLFKDWMYMGDLKRMVNGVLYNCKGGPFNPYCQDLYKIPDFRFTYMAFYWREIIGFHSTYKLDPHFYLSPSVIAQQVHELIVACESTLPLSKCNDTLLSQLRNETPSSTAFFADSFNTPPTHLE
ncbi:hypothetical protein HMI56_002324 [Coelomomyces lativittatus]|nr:hypothetical protein HMI56_002324 [Coelomomyces lativittatus]